MVDQNIVNYLSEGLRKGHDIESLKQMLLEHGHDEFHINEALGVVNGGPMVNPRSPRKKSGSKKIVFLVVVILVIVLTGAYFVFQPFSSDSDVVTQNSESMEGAQSQTEEEIVESEDEEETQGETEDPIEEDEEETQGEIEVVDCGEMPPNFATDTGEEYETYFADHPETKESLECISENFNKCVPSKIKYLDSEADSFFVVNRSEGDNCVIQYGYRGMGAECEYTPEQIGMIHASAEEEGEPWMDTFLISFVLGFRLAFEYSPGEEFDFGINNPETDEIENVSCFYYAYDYVAEEDEKRIIDGYKDGIISWDGSEYEEGEIYPEDNGECFYDSYFSLDFFFEENYSCSNACVDNGGTVSSKTQPLRKPTTRGNKTFAYQCVCDKCTDSEFGKIGFELDEIRCIMPGSNDIGITYPDLKVVNMVNTWGKDIGSEDWVVSRVNGVDEEIISDLGAQSSTSFSIDRETRWGMNIIELQLKDSDLQTFTIYC